MGLFANKGTVEVYEITILQHGNNRAFCRTMGRGSHAIFESTENNASGGSEEEIRRFA
jgi:hypothetical protein